MCGSVVGTAYGDGSGRTADVKAATISSRVVAFNRAAGDGNACGVGDIDAPAMRVRDVGRVARDGPTRNVDGHTLAVDVDACAIARGGVLRVVRLDGAVVHDEGAIVYIHTATVAVGVVEADARGACDGAVALADVHGACVGA